MPCIKIIDSIKLYVYANDHNPPHFHAIYVEHEELIIIDSLKTYIGQIPNTQKKKVVEWASKNQEYIMNQWRKLN